MSGSDLVCRAAIGFLRNWAATKENSAADGSARREYERRRAKDEAATRASCGHFGNIAVVLTPERQSTRAWSRGAIGEERGAAR